MDSSYCYIDYTKDNTAILHIENSYQVDEISYSTNSANLYFCIPSSTPLFALKEDENFILMLHSDKNASELINTVLNLCTTTRVKKMLQTLDGIFNLTIYDKKQHQLYISRDHMGILPLYYYFANKALLFSDSLKSFKKSKVFKKKLDMSTLGHYLQHGYILQPHTMFEDCYRVKSAHFIVVDLQTKEIKESKYWDIIDFYNADKVTLSKEQVIQKSEELLQTSIATKVGTSKRVGVLLSGGYDSSAIASILSKKKEIEVETYTIGFEEYLIDEAPFAKEVASYLGVNHHEYYFKAEHLQQLLLHFAEVYDQPLADKAALPTMLMCEKAQDKVDMLFGGEGGDEVFASWGFIKRVNQLSRVPYFIRWILSYILRPLAFNIKYLKWSKILKEKNIENTLIYEDMSLSFKGVKKLLKSKPKERKIEFDNTVFNPSLHRLDKIFPLLIKSYVSNNLLPKIYFATTAYKLTPKLPYLDRKLVEFLATVDICTKHQDKINKYILHKILQKYLPTKLIERPKKGFEVPVSAMLKNELRPFLDSYINQDRIEKKGIFNPQEVMRLKERFLNSNSYYDEQNIWNILIFELWYEHWYD